MQASLSVLVFVVLFQVFNVNSPASYKKVLAPYIFARYIRLLPITASGSTALRMELYGCRYMRGKLDDHNNNNNNSSSNFYYNNNPNKKQKQHRRPAQSQITLVAPCRRSDIPNLNRNLNSITNFSTNSNYYPNNLTLRKER